MKFSKQTLLGTGVVLGGSILLYATMHQILNTNTPPQGDSESALVTPAGRSDESSTPLTADIETEKNILAQKQKEREARVEQVEQAAEQYLTEQQRIEAEALARSRAENQLYTNRQVASTSGATITEQNITPREVETVNEDDEVSYQPTQATRPIAPKTTAAPVQVKQATTARVESQRADSTAKVTSPTAVVAKTQPITPKPVENNPQQVRPTSYQVKRGEGLIGLSRRYNVPVDILASANNLSTNASLNVGQTINIPSATQVQKIRQEAVIKEQQRQQEIMRKKQEALQKQQEQQQYKLAQDKLKQARQTVKETDAKGSFGVQVALAADESKAQEIAKKLQAAGYRVKTSQTSRGVRVVVGPETGKVAALALKDKLNNDPRVPVDGGWVLYW